MEFQVPIYIETVPRKDKATQYVARPLFLPRPVCTHTELPKLLTRTSSEVRDTLRALSMECHQEELAGWSFSPDLVEARHKFTLRLRRKTVRCELLVVGLRAFDRSIGFLPAIPALWFEVPKKQAIQTIAAQVLHDYWFEQEKGESEGWGDELDELAETGRAWLTTLSVDVPLIRRVRRSRSDEGRTLASLGGDQPHSGYEELFQVAHCLDHLYPDELERARSRDRESELVERLLTESDRRPLMLIGPHLVGKTTVLHEVVYRRAKARRHPYKYGRNVWHLSPQRLISGMKYVGDWESRLLAILKEVERRDHVLFFDDFLGLYYAGISSESDLAVAQILKPYVEEGRCRIVAEMTQEAWRVLQDRDRGFADLFHLIRIAPPKEKEVQRILIETIRQCELRSNTCFTPEVIPAVMELQRRYVRDAAFPGKASQFLRSIAASRENQQVDRDDVLEAFHQRSGLPLSVLDSGRKMTHDKITQDLGSHVIGQAQAIDAMAEVVSVIKARLNDPGRPIGSLLFVGPTGVGKTQCAKALATFLYGNSDRMLRFDMNEYTSADAITRLTGSVFNPEGLLTAAVRRQPFGVLLFDEIEKAHPDAFDLLLQVLGEGRLTDWLGRTSDFSGMVIIMTSNLGVRRAASSFGFKSGTGETERRAKIFLEEAERFFRPEFLNRLDRIVAFNNLSREDMRKIARLLIDEICSREGLHQRKCMLDIEPAAMDRIIDKGYHPELGARALKRSLEQHLVQPIARVLAATQADTPCVTNVYPRGDAIAVRVQACEEAVRQHLPIDDVDFSRPEEFSQRVRDALVRMDDRLREVELPDTLNPDELNDTHRRYLVAREYLTRTQNQFEAMNERLSRGVPLAPSPRIRTRVILQGSWGDKDILQAIRSTEDIRAFLRELWKSAVPAYEDQQESMRAMCREMAILNAVVGDLAGEDSRAVYICRPSELFVGFDLLWGVTARRLDALGRAGVRAWELDGPAIYKVIGPQRGTTLDISARGEVSVSRTDVLRLGPDDVADQAVRAYLDTREEWLAGLRQGAADVNDDPQPLLPVVAILAQGKYVDLRTGLMWAGVNKFDSVMRSAMLSLLELPRELMTGGGPSDA